MTKSRVAVLTATALALITIGCHDVNGPMAHSLQPPTAVRMTVSGAPDQTFSISAAQGFPPTYNYLMQFPWDTWVTLEAIGTVQFYAKPPINGASGNYIYPGRTVGGGTGTVDPYGDPCIMNLIPMDASVGMDSWGNCGSTARTVDTVLSLKLHNPYIIRGPLPSKHYYNCSNYTDVCDSTIAGAASSVREQPVPVTLKKLWRSSATIDTAHLASVQFKASFTPDSITTGREGKSQHPFHITLWQWIGADSTRNPTLTGCTATNLLCVYTPPESGRMIVKMFVGGWEQTNSATVQCLLSPADSALNDSTNDFNVREAFRAVLDTSNADSAAGAGWNASNPRWSASNPKGWVHESGGVIWKLPNGGGYMAVPYEDPNSNGCSYHMPSSQWDTSAAPVPGATPYRTYHDHPALDSATIYGCPDSANIDSTHKVITTQFPGDTNHPYPALAQSDSIGGPVSNHDSTTISVTNMPMYIVKKDGVVWAVDRQYNPTGYRAFDYPHKSGNRCTWPKKLRQ